MVGHLNSLFAPRGGNLNKPVFKSSTARGVARGGVLKLQFDWYITKKAEKRKDVGLLRGSATGKRTGPGHSKTN